MVKQPLLHYQIMNPQLRMISASGLTTSKHIPLAYISQYHTVQALLSVLNTILHQ